ncbi:O-antigen ligase family protein [Thiosulfativibrio zosterae]|uniref:O-antigen biosynthesis protein n=1 Tax=Thiosulfativibrio zosterae TaxID=2675053 RepID=A0A6F8PPW0_9GAMM|nr:O-antigen ligase family protein [Thiosulfativibrio zosterae]BBP44030.1 O-antigen biosynthesis protein [Thiosulfativibrio zosterae]
MLSFINLQEKRAFIERLERYSIIGIVFFIPISPAAPNLLGLLLILLWIIKGQYQESWLKVKSQPLFWAFMAYLVIYPLSLIWSEDQAWGAHMVERHMIFLLFPFLLMASRYEDLPKYLAAFIMGMTLTELTSYLVWFEWLHLEGISPENPSPFYRHTIYNPMLAWGLYLVLQGLLYEHRSLPIKFFFALFATTMTINMFITEGRSGQIAFLILSGLIFLQYFAARGHIVRGVVVALVFVITVVAIAYYSSPLFNQRVNLAVSEVQNFQPSDQTSVGTRVGFYINTLEMSMNRPIDQFLLGSGVGDFPADYTASLKDPNAVKLYAGTEPGHHSHPHNQYLYELGALGLMGFMTFMAMFAAMIKVARSQKDNFQPHRVAFLVFMGIVMLSDSLLLAHGTAVLFIVFSALLYANHSSKVSNNV